MKQLSRKKTRFLGLTRFLSFSPLQRCMVRVKNDNSAGRWVPFREKEATGTLNHHLFMKNIFGSPVCICGGIETSEYFFFSSNVTIMMLLTLYSIDSNFKALTTDSF